MWGKIKIFSLIMGETWETQASEAGKAVDPEGGELAKGDQSRQGNTHSQIQEAVTVLTSLRR
jgi:hypothetical protein